MTSSPFPEPADARIRVLHFTNEPVRGGAEEHMLMLLRELDRARFRAYVACPAACLEKLRPDLRADVTAWPIEFSWPWQAGAAARFAKLLRRARIGILHSHMFHSSFAASPVAWLCRVPVIIETPHVREAWRKGWLKGSYFPDRVAGRFVDRYIAVSEANAKYLREEKKLPARKIQAIQNGSDLRRFDPARPAPLAMKQALGFREADPVVLMMGRLEPQKGHSVLLEAFAQVVRDVPQARLLCLGEGALRSELEQHARRLGIAESVRFLGFQRNVEDWLALASFTVLPSFFEGLPLVAIESLAAGKAMVATAVDGTTEVVLHERTGLTVPPGDSRALASAIVRLLRDPGLSAQLGRAGREWVLERFSRERQVRDTEALYLAAWRAARRSRANAAAAKTAGPVAPETTPRENA